MIDNVSLITLTQNKNYYDDSTYKSYYTNRLKIEWFKRLL